MQNTWLVRLRALLAMLLLGAATSTLVAQPADTLEAAYRPNQVIVKLRPGYAQQGQVKLPAGVAAGLQARLGALQWRQLFPQAEPPREGDPRVPDLRKIFVLHYQAAVPVPQALQHLQRYAAFWQYAEPRVSYHPLNTFTPAEFDSAAHWFASNARAEDAWAEEKGDTSVTIGIIDSGVDWDHPDLADNLALNWADPVNGVDDDNNGYVDDFRGWDVVGDSVGDTPDNAPAPVDSATHPSRGHGTAVTSFAAAVTDNDTGTVGTGFRCRFVPVKAAADFDNKNRYLNLPEAIVYAAEREVDVMNMSFGSLAPVQTLEQAIEYATFQKDVLCVAAAGNAANDPVAYPAAYEEVLAVAASNRNGVVNTSRGPAVALTAPGNGRHTTFGGGLSSGNTPFTSYAAPVTAGAAALVRASFPSLSALQALHRVRVTSDRALYAIPPNAPYKDRYGYGSLDMASALTTNMPAIRATNMQYQDGNNGVPESGDTITLNARYRNFLVATNNLNARIEPVSSALTPLTNSVNLGVIQNSKQDSTLRFVLDQSLADNQRIRFKLIYEDNAFSYRDYQIFELVVNPTFVSLRTDSLATTLSSRGNWGYNDYNTNQQGVGLRYNGRGSLLFEGGCMVGLPGEGKLSDNLRDSLTSGTASGDFTALQNIGLSQLPNEAGQQTVARFTDAGSQGAGDEAIGVALRQEGYAFNSSPNRKFVLLRYVITNNSPNVYDSLYWGQVADFDLGQSGNDNTVWEAGRQLLATYGDDLSGSNVHAGMKVLEANAPVRAFASEIGPFDYSDSAKLAALQAQTPQQVDSADAMTLLGFGPFKLFPNQTDTFAIAVVVGDNFGDLRSVADQAQQKYFCFFKAPPFKVALQEQFEGCDSVRISAATPAAQQYNWNTGASGPELTVTQTGAYSVQVRDTLGCRAEASTQVSVAEGPLASITASDSVAAPGELIQFSAPDNGGASEWIWDFDDGYGFLQRTARHRFDRPGTYSVQLVARNNICADTATRMIEIRQGVARPAAADATSLRIGPNPFGRRLQIQLPEDATLKRLELRSPTGRLLRRAHPGAEAPISLQTADWPAGLYLLRVQFQRAGQTHQVNRRLMKR